MAWRWEAFSVGEVVAVFAGAPFRWWICGGHALELHLGESWRAHDDTDVGVVRDDARRVYDWLHGWDLMVAAGGALTVWDGRPLPPGDNNVWARRGDGGFAFDVTVGTGTDAEWVFRRDPRLRRPWPEAVLVTPSGVPYLAPELQLLFKAKNHRRKDDADAARVIPLLGPEQRRLLAAHLGDHAWRRLLAGDG